MVFSFLSEGLNYTLQARAHYMSGTPPVLTFLHGKGNKQNQTYQDDTITRNPGITPQKTRVFPYTVKILSFSFFLSIHVRDTDSESGVSIDF